MADPMGPTLLVYGATAALAALYVVASIGVLCLFGEAVCRIVRFHKRGLARLGKL